MAFDQGTRNRLQRLVSDCRKTLTDEFTLQLQQDYGLDPRTGEVTELSRLTHLTDRERHTAALLRETLAHYLAGEGESKAQRQAAIDRIIREQAFTVLNRLAALLMMEARGLLRESVSKAAQSEAFELYRRVAGTALGETGEAYQTFLFSLFDEFALDLPALFDRFAPQGRLFPRETALNELLALLNDHEIEPLWALDETIGWIYQYFNSQEERKAMRKASQAPRNSRELAVRNQFFTPRYVVEFLVDNTLGRQWFNATGGTTPLRDSCQYLLVKPDEQPEVGAKLRDPRTLKLLDPACGSMHFGLYAFDLFLQIYRDAWRWEQQHGPGSLDLSTQPEAGFEPLCHTYADEEALLRDVPRLIIEHNIYGVDIDPRAAQIASLALWLRAQRAWHEAGIQAMERPDVGQGNVIAAVAPPAEKELREAFAARLDRQDAELFEKTLQMLKGLPELGVLLRAEKELPTLIRQVYVGKGSDLFAEQEQETWQKAEQRLRRALLEFSEEAGATYQSRLFAQDSLQGLRMIDLCRVVFDVVVMNPPFGKLSKASEPYLRKNYFSVWTDVYACFLMRFIEKKESYVGAITSSQFFYTKQMRNLRKAWVEEKSLVSCIELGKGVLDTATVDTALTITSPDLMEKTNFLDLSFVSEKSDCLTACVREFGRGGGGFRDISLSDLSQLYLAPFCYHMGAKKLQLWSAYDVLDPGYASLAVGNNTFDDFRFKRLRWEVDSRKIKEVWHPYEEGGRYQPFFSPTPVLYKWGSSGEEARAFQIHKFGTDAQVKQSITYWWKEGITYPRVSSVGFGPRYMPKGHIFSGDSISVFPDESVSIKVLLGYLCSTFAEDLTYAFGRYRKIESRAVANLPYPGFSGAIAEDVSKLTLSAIGIFISLEEVSEVSPLFVCPPEISVTRSSSGLGVVCSDYLESEVLEDAKILYDDLDNIVGSALYEGNALPALSAPNRYGLIKNIVERKLSDQEVSLAWVSWFVGCAFGRWDPSLSRKKGGVSFSDIEKDGLPVDPPARLNSRDLVIPRSVVLDDFSAKEGMAALVEEHVFEVFGSDAHVVQEWLLSNVGARSMRDYIRSASGFFVDHLKMYSVSSRKAPIYWPLVSASGNFTLWIYYPDLTDQTLFTAVNDFVEPRLNQVESELGNLRLAGASRSRADEKRLEGLSDYRDELADLRDTLLRIAPGYKPDHDDGVQITAAPLWPLFRHRPWQNVLRDTWEKLEQGDYDWAHLAMAYWPERVREKCVTDNSLAIAHDLEHLYVEPEPAPKKARGRKKASDG